MRFWPRRRLLQVLLILVLLFIIAVIIDQLWVAIDRRITISESTTRLTSPLDHGYPDYLAAINASHAEGVTPESNAAIPIIEIIGTADMAAAEVPEVFRLLGANAPANPLFVSFDQWVSTHGIPIPTPDSASFDGFADPTDSILWFMTDDAYASPWTASQHPILSRYLDDIQPAFAKLEVACKKDHCYYPAVTADGRSSGAARFSVIVAALPSMGIHRLLADTLLAHAMQRLGTADPAGFSRDIITGTRYARLLARHPSLIGYLSAIDIDALMERTVQTAATSGKLSPADALALYQELDRIGPMPTPSHTIDKCERYVILDAICSLNAGKGDSALSAVDPIGDLTKATNTVGAVVPTNYNHALRQANSFYDRFRDAMDKPDCVSAKADIDAIESQLDTLRNRSYNAKMLHLEDTFLIAFTPFLGSTYQRYTSDLQERDLALIALQLRAARANNQPFPESLATLKDIPNDRFTGQPLIYKRQANGFLLYSLGPNLKDDAGVRTTLWGKGDLSVEAAQ